jgi:diguanylate cyclase (GGDEF)-like protein
MPFRRRKFAGLLFAFTLPVSGIAYLRSTASAIAGNAAPSRKLSLPRPVRLPDNLSGTPAARYLTRASDAGVRSAAVHAGPELSPLGDSPVASVTQCAPGSSMQTPRMPVSAGPTGADYRAQKPGMVVAKRPRFVMGLTFLPQGYNTPAAKNRGFLVRAGLGVATLTVLCTLCAFMLRHRVQPPTNRPTESLLVEKKAAAAHDSLTGIANRRHFEDSLASPLRSARITGGEVALFSIDLGDFRCITGMGHSAGDLQLKRIAQTLGAALDSSQLLSRVGGDELTVIQPAAAGKRSSEQLARRLLELLDGPFVSAGTGIEVGASIGISRYPIDGGDVEQLLSNADAAMYHAKRNGRGFYFFESSMREVMRKLEIRRQLPAALDRGEFVAHFQPIEGLSKGSLVRFEALCRWNNPQLGSVRPSEFIPIAEETGQIHSIGKWMLQEACRQGCRWQVDEYSPVRLAVNVSALQFLAEDFVETVAGVLAATGFQASLLELELTESVLVNEPEERIRQMLRLRDMGVSVSMDDFGTGYSSLSYLQKMPFVAFKIDRSFIAKVDSNPTVVNMISSIIAMGHALGLRVVTEGVETADQLEIARQLGSDEVQGLYIGKPVNAETALQIVVQADSHRRDLWPLESVVAAAPAT